MRRLICTLHNMLSTKMHVLLSLASVTIFIMILLSDRTSSFIQPAVWNRLKSFEYSDVKNMKPVAKVKTGNRWIVVTSISSPTEDVKRLASFEDWNLVVVADTKTPLNWSLEGVHFLSVDYQSSLPFSLIGSLPFKSYTRKNVGYLYAISQGAEWIYDTDDDNKPHGLGLKQFQYSDTVSGIRYRPQNGSNTEIRQRLFNPYRFFGMDQMWPRGFPLEHLEKHTNGKETQVLCRRMKRAAVQQGLVHHDPDVDAIYRLLHADANTGLDVGFNKFAPPITLSVGTYAPWNSQNTLFHKSAFHTLFLPTTVSFRTTDIWRSFISQRILHLSGLTVAFTPTNAVQYRNAHDYLKDYKDEKQVYEDSGKMIEYLHNWTCSSGDVPECMKILANELVDQNLWGREDANLLELFLKDLKLIGYAFPGVVAAASDQYAPSTNETSRDVNCRRMSLSFDLVDPKKEGQQQSVRLATKKLNYFGDLVSWCNESGYSNLTKKFPSPEQLAEEHDEQYVLQKDQNSVLVIVNNFPWKWGMGVLQRIYEPYFASVVFCGSWYPDMIAANNSNEEFTGPIDPINYVHMNPAEIYRGYMAYHCVSLVRQMHFSNVQGYFLMADDSVFNIWHRVDYERVHHVRGVTHSNEGVWWDGKYGIDAAKKIVETVKHSTDQELLATWKKYEEGLRKYNYIMANETAETDITNGRGRSVSDFFYIPTNQIDYYSSLMTLFYDNEFFLELAVNRFLRSVNHQTASNRESSYLWDMRGKWHTHYHANLTMMHPVKLSVFQKPGPNRVKYCGSVLKTWAGIMFGGSRNFTIKNDNDPDYLNG